MKKIKVIDYVNNIKSEDIVRLNTKSKKLTFTKYICELYRLDLEKLFRNSFSDCVDVNVNLIFDNTFEQELSIIKKYSMILLYMYYSNPLKHSEYRNNIIFMLEYLKDNILENMNITGDLLCGDADIPRIIKKMNYKLLYIHNYVNSSDICIGEKIHQRFKLNDDLFINKKKIRQYRDTFYDELIDYSNEYDIFMLNKKIFTKIK